MAKVVITLEDEEKNEDGKTRLIVRADFPDEYDEKSVAQSWGEMIVELISANAKETEHIEEGPLRGSETDTDKH